MAYSKFAVGDLVKLIKGAPGESKAIWRINDFLTCSDELKLKKYNGPEALTRNMATEKGNVRGLTDDELEGLSMWSRGSFVRTTYKGIPYIGKVHHIIWDREKGVSAHVTLAGQCIPEGVSKNGEPKSHPINRYRITLEEAKLVDCTEAQVEWLEDQFTRVPGKSVLPMFEYHHHSGQWWVTEDVKITSTSEIVEAAAGVKKRNEAGPTSALAKYYGSHKDENGEHFYTKRITRRLDSDEVEQHRLRPEEQKRIGNPRGERFTPEITFDDIVHPDKLLWNK